jgi:UDP-glucose 4-epimerase
MQIDLSDKTVLVTGGTGFVGSHIAERLHAQCRNVLVFDNGARGNLQNLEWAKPFSNVRLVEGDLRDCRSVDNVLNGVDVVFHQAAIRIPLCAQQPRLCVEVMIDGTFNLLEAAIHHKIKKIVAASSLAVYGTPETFPTEEIHHLYNNRTLYGVAKIANEQMLRAFYEMYGLNYVVLRYFNLYGPGMDITSAHTEVIIRWLDCIDRNEPPVIHGDGNQTIDWVYIDDVANANLIAMKSDVSDEILNIGTGVETSLNELWAIIKDLTGTRLNPIYKDDRKLYAVSRRQACTRKAEELLRFRAKTTLREGLQQLITWREKCKAAMPQYQIG